jgi:hypothetical protein
VTVLRVDPWDPEYGASLELEAPEELRQTVELDVEPVPWQPITPPVPDGALQRVHRWRAPNR